jgi:hypothetical protein
MSDMFDVAPTNLLDLDAHSVGCSESVSIINDCGIGEDDDNEKMWGVLRPN